MHKLKSPAFLLLALALAFAVTPAARAQINPSSDLLVPYFEIDLESRDLTTLFAVGNSILEPVPIMVRVHSNWGIVLLEVPLTLEPDELLSVNLYDWLVQGNLPGRVLTRAERDHLQAALSGRASPRDELFYGTETALDRAVGYVTIRVNNAKRSAALWGDYFVVIPSEDFAQGDTLVDINPSSSCLALCGSHALRFLEGGAFDGGTELVVWTDKVLTPARNPVLPRDGEVLTQVVAHDQRGAALGTSDMDLPPVGTVKVSRLGLGNPFGWFRLFTERDAFVSVRFSALQRFSVSLQTTCLPLRPSPGPAIRIQKRTNGSNADLAPGPSLALGSAITWAYEVTNTGAVPLEDVTVLDDDPSLVVSCPGSDLAPGETMLCTAEGSATACQYRNVGTALGYTADRVEVTDNDPSHYFVAENAALTIEKATDGQDADNAPGPQIQVGQAVHWTYQVTNTGAAALDGVVVRDDDPSLVVSCPKSSLAAGESMTCTASGTAALGQYKNVGTVEARTAGCGAALGDSDPSHYMGMNGPPPPPPPPPPVCGQCDGKVTALTLRYLGHVANAMIEVVQKKDGQTVWSGIVQPGSSFSFVGADDKGTLSTEIKIFVNGSLDTAIHTSCSQPIGPGLISGDFEVIAGASRNGGPLCPIGGGGGDSGSDSGDSGSDSGDSGSDSGDSGDSGSDSGDSGGDSGDSGSDSGDSGDSGSDSGDSGSDSGDSGGYKQARDEAPGESESGSWASRARSLYGETNRIPVFEAPFRPFSIS